MSYACDADQRLFSATNGRILRVQDTAFAPFYPNVQHLFLTRDQNPGITLTASATGKTWRYTDPNHVLVRIKSEVESEWVRHYVRASRPIFVNGMQRAGWRFSNLPSGATSEVWVPRMTGVGEAWVNLPSQCTRLTDSACQNYRSRPAPNQDRPYTFPGIVGNVSLLPNQVIRIDFNSMRYFPVSGGVARAPVETGIDSALLLLDPEIIVVPVKVHVFVDRNFQMPENPLRLFGTPPLSSQNVAEYSDAIRRQIDDDLTKVTDLASASGRTRANLWRDPLDENAMKQPWDSIFGQCGIQMRLEYVNYIRQDMGAERDPVSLDANVRDACSFLSPDTPLQRFMQDVTEMTGDRRSVNIYIVNQLTSRDAMFPEGQSCNWTRANARRPVMNMAMSRANFKEIAIHETIHSLGISLDGTHTDLLAIERHEASASHCARMRDWAARIVN
jgi:hypothetical protein